MFMRKVQPYLAALMAVAVSAPPSLAQQKTQTERDNAWYSRMTDRYTSRESRAHQPHELRAHRMRFCAPAGCTCRCRMQLRLRSKTTWTSNCSGMAPDCASRSAPCAGRWCRSRRSDRHRARPDFGNQPVDRRRRRNRCCGRRRIGRRRHGVAERTEPRSCSLEPRYRPWTKLRL